MSTASFNGCRIWDMKGKKNYTGDELVKIAEDMKDPAFQTDPQIKMQCSSPFVVYKKATPETLRKEHGVWQLEGYLKPTCKWYSFCNLDKWYLSYDPVNNDWDFMIIGKHKAQNAFW